MNGGPAKHQPSLTYARGMGKRELATFAPGPGRVVVLAAVTMGTCGNTGTRYRLWGRSETTQRTKGYGTGLNDAAHPTIREAFRDAATDAHSRCPPS